MIRREIQTWPDADGIRVFSHAIAGAVCDAWGLCHRPFIVRDG